MLSSNLCPYFYYIIYLLLSFESCLYLLDTNHLPDMMCKYFLQSWLKLSFLNRIFQRAEVIILRKSHLLLFSFVVVSEKFCLIQGHRNFLLFSSGNFILLGFTFSPVTHLEICFFFPFLYSARYG